MNREELLKILRNKISEHDYIALVAWTGKKEKYLFGLLKTKFSLKPTTFGKGYIVSINKFSEWIIVYK